MESTNFYVSPIATPMALPKFTKKVLRQVKKAQKQKQLKRGVKEVLKAIRKDTKGVCILAGDVSPIDVISAIPIQCENKNIPYIYVRSRMELGLAAETKKPTSVVLIVESDKKEEKYKAIKEKILKQNPYM